MRLCVIGNSHIAARKSAIRDGLVSLGPLEVEFWGMSRGRFETTYLNEGIVHSRFPEIANLVSEGRYRELPLDDFDILLFEGTFLPIGGWLRDCSLRNIDIQAINKRHVLDAIASHLDACAVFRLATSSAARQKQRVFLSPSPVQAMSAVSQEIYISHSHKEYLNMCIDIVCSSKSIEYLPQPRETLSDFMYTLQKYSDGAVRLSDHSAVLPDDEVIHMNARYGARTWAAFLNRLAADRASDAAGAGPDIGPSGR